MLACVRVQCVPGPRFREPRPLLSTITIDTYAPINAGGFASALMQKDLSIAGDAARTVGAPLPMAALAQQIYALLASHGQGGRDFSAVYEFVAGAGGGAQQQGKKK